jgi:NAD(P)-dependent dehydrogenase (short-subunit alcohol dehydrogenase family)
VQRFEGRAVLVTGAGSGIGRASALRIASEGGEVACVDLVGEAAGQTAERIESDGGRAMAVPCDVSQETQAAAAVEATAAQFGRLDALVNAAGVLSTGHTHETELDEWNRVLSVNLTGTFLVTRRALPHLLTGGGAIVNLASTAALGGHPWMAAYSASKGGILAFTRTLAVEYGRQGLRANAVAPGGVQTNIQASFHLPEGADSSLLHRISPLDDFRGPESTAGAIAYLASDDAAHVNGTCLTVDGGTLA